MCATVTAQRYDKNRHVHILVTIFRPRAIHLHCTTGKVLNCSYFLCKQKRNFYTLAANSVAMCCRLLPPWVTRSIAGDTRPASRNALLWLVVVKVHKEMATNDPVFIFFSNIIQVGVWIFEIWICIDWSSLFSVKIYIWNVLICTFDWTDGLTTG